MHLSDALLSPAVAVTTAVVSLAAITVATRRIGRANDPVQRQRLIPLMGVLGAFVFAAQMLNFSIPGTGSSGHLIGGILLAAVLGPWGAVITLASVIVLQCLLFADGGFMALGANILNMAVLPCLIVYPLVFRPLLRFRQDPRHITAASMIASIVALALGAVAITVETELSGITALPWGRFLLFMLPIHLAIGVGEGAATGAVLCALDRYHPELLQRQLPPRRSRFALLTTIALVALLLGASFGWVASSKPDGLEWSVAHTAGTEEVAEGKQGLHRMAASVQQATALVPDYEASFSGILGCSVLLALAWGSTKLLRSEGKDPR